MNAENKRIVEENVAYVGEILEDIYHRLSGPVTEEGLAEILKHYFPSESDEQLIQYCGRLRRGIQKGRENFDELAAVPEEEQETEIMKKLEASLSGISEEEQHQRLVLFYQTLCHQHHRKVDENLAVYLAGLSTDRLKQEVSFLVKQESTCTVDEMLSVVREEEGKITVPESASMYTDDENSWIMSAAIYTAARQKGHKIADPMKIGEEVGFSKSFFTKLDEAARTKILPIGLGILTAAAAFISVHTLVGFLAASQLVAAVYAILLELSPVAIGGVTILGLLYGYLQVPAQAGIWVYENTLQMLNHPRVEAAENALEDRFRIIQDQADSMAANFSPTESENEQELLEEDDVYEESGTIFA